jgi:hypothetical protein
MAQAPFWCRRAIRITGVRNDGMARSPDGQWIAGLPELWRRVHA